MERRTANFIVWLDSGKIHSNTGRTLNARLSCHAERFCDLRVAPPGKAVDVAREQVEEE
jgi:hypothetical protein